MPVDPARAKTLFLAAAELVEPGARAEFLDHECGADVELRARVEALLHADNAKVEKTGDFTPVDEANRESVPLALTAPLRSAEAAGAVVGGRYALVEPIGEGGMGSVWRAKQTEPVKRFVAVKLIKAGMDSRQVLSRFEAERQALALMDHPNIAKVLDGGLHEQRPFFVMELVKGTPITEFCDANRLTPPQRLELFVQACQAIQHAHQKGIIHRDIKPSNVLVALFDDRPVVKVIDFGVAKATGGALSEATIDTGLGAVVGTPQYMSPEQATFNNVDIDTRSDVYALGVLLYELLTGTPPFSGEDLKRKGLLEILRVVREDEPPRPSTKLSTADALPSISANRGTEPKKLTGLLRNELDWIVMKALEKDRTRRYETANGFAADVLRYLNGEAVNAHPPSTTYRLKKLVRRYRGRVIATAAVFVTLLCGIAGTTLGLLEAKRQERIARSEAREKENARAEEAQQRGVAEERRRAALVALKRQEKTTEALVGVLRNIDPTSEEKEGLPLRALLARNLMEAADALDSGDAGDAVSTARMQSFLGAALIGAGDPKAAIAVLERAVAAYRDRLGPDDPATLDATNQLALALRANGQHNTALDLLADTLRRSQDTRGADHLETLGLMNNLAVTYRSAGLTAKALPYYVGVEAKTRATMGSKHQSTLTAANDLALAHKDLGRADEALPLLEDTLEHARTTLGSDHPLTLNVINNLGGMYANMRERKKAMPLLIEALAGRRAKLGPTHPDTLQSLHVLAMAHVDAGEPVTAVPLLEAALQGRRARFGADHPGTLNTAELLAQAYAVGGQLEKSLPLMADTLARSEARLGKDHPGTLGLMNNLAASYWHAKQFDKAVSMFERLLPLHEAKLGKDHPLTINVQANLGVNYGEAGRLKEAVAILEDAARKMDKHPSVNVARLSWVPLALNTNYERAGLHDKAEASYRKRFDDAVRRFGADHADTANAGVLLAINLLKQARNADAEPLLVKAVATREKADPDAWTTFNTHSLLGGALLGIARTEKDAASRTTRLALAEALLVRGYEGMKAREASIPKAGGGELRIPEALDRLIELHTATDNTEKVNEWRELRAKYPTPGMATTASSEASAGGSNHP
jgi:serine/threonine protein kinase/tetratricopeptide (TPR) repeat protein